MEILEKRTINGTKYEIYLYLTDFDKNDWRYKPGMIISHIILKNDVIDVSYHNVKINYTKIMAIQAVDKILNDFIIKNRDNKIKDIFEYN
jgi:hypothetical protein